MRENEFASAQTPRKDGITLSPISCCTPPKSKKAFTLEIVFNDAYVDIPKRAVRIKLNSVKQVYNLFTGKPKLTSFIISLIINRIKAFHIRWHSV